MQAVVKTPRIEISVRGAAIPPRLMDVLKEEYGMEHGRRSISLKMARKLSLLLSAPIEKFIEAHGE